MTANTKHYTITGKGDNTQYETLEAATDQAKRYVGDRRRNSGYDTYNVYQLVAVVTSPVPEAIVTAV